MKLVKGVNVTPLDIINSTGSIAFRECVNEAIPIKGMALCEQDDRTYAFIYGKDGNVFAGNADAVVKTAGDLIDAANDGTLGIDIDTLAIKISERQSKQGRTYLVMVVMTE